MKWLILDAQGFVVGIQTNAVQPANSVAATTLPIELRDADQRFIRYANGEWSTIDEAQRRAIMREKLRTKLRTAFTSAQTDILLSIIKRVEEKEEDPF